MNIASKFKLSSIFLGVALIYNLSYNEAFAGNCESKINLENPLPGVVTGIGTISGWAVGNYNLQASPAVGESVRLFIDDVYITEIPYGGIRNDVAEAFPECLDSGKSGFSMIYNFNNLPSGEHKISACSPFSCDYAKVNVQTLGFDWAKYINLYDTDVSVEADSGIITIKNVNLQNVNPAECDFSPPNPEACKKGSGPIFLGSQVKNSEVKEYSTGTYDIVLYFNTGLQNITIGSILPHVNNPEPFDPCNSGFSPLPSWCGN